MAKIDRYNGNVRAFAADSLGTERTVFGATTQSDTLDGNITLDLLRGWGVVGVNEDPTKQDFNGLAFTLGQLLAYLHQRGVPEWNADQEYYQGSVVTTLAGVYRLKSGGDGTVDPDSDGGTNWAPLPTRAEVDAKADQATTYTKTKVDELVATRTESPGETTVTGTATFTNSTNNLALTGIGSIGLEIGDVVRVTGTASNNKLFTVEVITDSGNVIVNQAHAGGTTTKSLVDEAVSATVTLVAKWYNAANMLGQGIVALIAVRSLGVTYTNNTRRSIGVMLRMNTPAGAEAGAIEIDGVRVTTTSSTSSNISFQRSFTVPPGSAYKVLAGFLNVWSEIR